MIYLNHFQSLSHLVVAYQSWVVPSFGEALVVALLAVHYRVLRSSPGLACPYQLTFRIVVVAYLVKNQLDAALEVASSFLVVATFLAVPALGAYLVTALEVASSLACHQVASQTAKIMDQKVRPFPQATDP